MLGSSVPEADSKRHSDSRPKFHPRYVELGIGGSIDDTHTAFADLLRDLVVGDASADQRDLQNQAKLV